MSDSSPAVTKPRLFTRSFVVVLLVVVGGMTLGWSALYAVTLHSLYRNAGGGCSDEFDQGAWQSVEELEDRYPLACRLVEDRTLIGMTQSDLEALLGPSKPHRSLPDYVRWDLGSEPGIIRLDPIFLVVELRDGVAASAHIWG